MKVLIIGGVAAGTKVAAKLKREDRSLDVLILTKGKDISYAGCGLPYYVGGVIPTREQLIVNTPESFSKLTGAEVQTETEVTAVDTAAKTCRLNSNALTQETESETVRPIPSIPSPDNRAGTSASQASPAKYPWPKKRRTGFWNACGNATTTRPRRPSCST